MEKISILILIFVSNAIFSQNYILTYEDRSYQNDKLEYKDTNILSLTVCDNYAISYYGNLKLVVKNKGWHIILNDVISCI